MLEINQQTKQMDERDITFVNHAFGVYYVWKWQHRNLESTHPIQLSQEV